MSSATTQPHTTPALTKQQKKKQAKKRHKRSKKMNASQGLNLEKDVLRPLTPEQKSKAYEVKAAYADWWNNRKFTKGWAQPLFTYQEVEQLLEKAAEIVVRIRSHLDEVNPGMKLRMTDGSAREFLWGQEEHPSKDPEKFVRDMVHATLSDGNGYVEGLTKEKIDQYIETIEKHLAQEQVAEVAKLEEAVRHNWKEADELIKELLNKSAEDKQTPQFALQLQSILSKLGTLTKDMKEIKKGKDRRSLSLSSSASASHVSRASSEPESGVVPVTKADAPTEPAKEATAPESTTDAPAETETKTEETEKSESKPTEDERTPMQVEEKEEASPQDAEKKAQEEKEQQEREQREREEKEKAEREARREQARQTGMLKIQRVADDVHSLRGQIQGLSEGANVLDVEDLAKEPESSDKLLDKLQKQCLAYSEGLMKDLLALDAIVSEPEMESEGGEGSEGGEEQATGVRPLRKKQVKEIQALLQSVDEVNAKLKSMRARIQKEKKALEEERKKQEAERKQKEDEEKAQQKEQMQEEEKPEAAAKTEQGESSEEETPKRAASPSKEQQQRNEKWKDLKLKPKFEIKQQRDSVVLQAYIPGMNEDDITISIGGDEHRGHTLTVSGFRSPTAEEEAALKRQLRAYAQRDPYGLYFPRNEPDDILLLRMGAGRYGSFSETFQLSDTMDHDNLSAAYNGGVLQITIPRKQPVQRMRPTLPQRGRPYIPAGYPRQSDGFFNDRSFWW